MELGEKLRQARLEAGLTQRQLCGGEITRNMLSQIEHGTARPSMKTLQYLAARLEKSVSYFLEESAVVSPNLQVMTDARRAYDAGNFPEAAAALEAYRGPDDVYDREKTLLWVLVHLELARQALEEGKEPYALALLEKADVESVYCREELKRRRLLLLGAVRGQQVCNRLPSLDAELLIRAEEAFASGEAQRAAQLLDAAQEHAAPRWNLLRGEVYLAQAQFADAVRCFHRAEEAFPKQTAPKLESCYRELGDYRQAYEYACKQKA